MTLALDNSAHSKTLAERLGSWAAELHSDQVPGRALDSAIECVVDTLGCALAGVHAPVARAVRDTMLQGSTVGTSTVLGSRQRLPPAQAAFANSTAAHALELDDTDSTGFCHAGAVVVPATLAAAEAYGATGLECLTAIVIGYEVTVRLARWMNPEHRLRGFHTTATVPTLGAAAAVGRLAGMDRTGITSALGVAGSFASGTFEFLTDGSNLKRVHAGKAAFGAIQSVDLVRNGVEGPASVLEGPTGLYATMAEPTVAPLDLGDLGECRRISEVGRKPYPCCRFCHGSIDSAVALHKQGIAKYELGEVTVTVGKLCAEQTSLAMPVNELQRQFSTPYGVALGLLYGSASLSDYRDQPDERALELARHVKVVVDPDLPVADRKARVTVRSNAGTTWDAETAVPKGEPQNPLSTDELRTKFFDLAAHTLQADEAVRLYRRLCRLRKAADVRDVTEALSSESDN